jgi:hypothetical protein
VPPHYIQNLNDNVYVLNHLLQQSQIINSSKQNKIKLNGSVGGRLPNPSPTMWVKGVVSALIAQPCFQATHSLAIPKWQVSILIFGNGRDSHEVIALRPLA